MNYKFSAVKYIERMKKAGTPISASFMPILMQTDTLEVETICGYDGNTLDYGFVHLSTCLPMKVMLIDCEEVLEECPFPEDPHKDVVCSMERGNVRVSFVNLGEGYNGDYNPDDPTDQNLLRLDVDLRSPFTGEFEEEGSVCTLLPANNPMPVIKRALEALLNCVCEELFRPETDSSLRLRIDSLSYIDEGNIEDYEKDAADARIQRVAYERYQMHWLLDHGVTVDTISEMAEGWLGECGDIEEEPRSFKSYINEYGFSHGSLYPCFGEFLGAEYLMPELMFDILPRHEVENYVRSLGVKVYEYSKTETEEERNLRLGHTKYWCNSCGELHRYGKEMIAESELPSDLRRAYHVLWSDCYGFPCYLVEMGAESYGVALVNEYPAHDKKAFDTAMIDAAHLAIRLSNAKITLAENAGCDESHELVICFPTDISSNEMDAAVKEVNDILEK